MSTEQGEKPQENSSEATRKDLLSALTGCTADRTCSMAFRTRRIVSTSAGLLSAQKAQRKHCTGMAIAAILALLFAMGPMIWAAVELVRTEEHFFGPIGQVSLFVFFTGGAFLAAILLAGWLRRRP